MAKSSQPIASGKAQEAHGHEVSTHNRSYIVTTLLGEDNSNRNSNRAHDRIRQSAGATYPCSNTWCRSVAEVPVAHGLVTGLVHRAAGVRCGSTSRCAPAACNAWGHRMPCMDTMHGLHDSDIFKHTDSKLKADRSIGQQRRHRRTARCLELRIPGQASLNWAQPRRESPCAPCMQQGYNRT